MNTTPEIFVYGNETLSCSIGELEDAVFSRVEGIGDVTGSGCGVNGWNLDLEFDTPNLFVPILHAVLEALHEQDVDPQSVTVSVHGTRRKLVDLL